MNKYTNTTTSWKLKILCVKLKAINTRQSTKDALNQTISKN